MPRLHGTLPLITTRADLCEQEGSGGVAEDRANHVQEARVNASLGMGLSMPKTIQRNVRLYIGGRNFFDEINICLKVYQI